MNDPCFCHFNGFAVKDATARQQIAEEAAAREQAIKAEAAAREQAISAEAAARIREMEAAKGSMRETYITAQRHVTYDFTDNASCQGMCIDVNNKMYVYAEINYPYGNLYVFDLNTMRYEKTIENAKMYHGNDLTYHDGKLYVAACYGENKNTASKTICVYDLTTGLLQEVNPFAAEESKALFALSSYDDNHILCALKDETQTLEGVSFYLLNVTDLTYTKIEVTDLDKINTNFFTVLQSCEYVNGYIYLMVSCTNALVSFELSGTTARMDRVYNLPYIDSLGVTVGEYEGVSKIPSGAYGSGTIALSAQIYQKKGAVNETTKTYLINPVTDLPVFSVKRWLPEDITEAFRTVLYVNSESANLYEDGTKEYPFKDLSRAISCSNRCNTFHAASIVITGGTEYTFGLHNGEQIDISAECEHNIILKNIHANFATVAIAHSVEGCYIELQGEPYFCNSKVNLSRCKINDEIKLETSDCVFWACVSAAPVFTAFVRKASTLRLDITGYAHDNKWYRMESTSTIYANNADTKAHITSTDTCSVITPNMEV